MRSIIHAKKRWPLAAAMLVSAPLAFPADLAEQLAACGELTSDALRLECFEALVAPAPAPAAPAAAEPAVTDAVLASTVAAEPVTESPAALEAFGREHKVGDAPKEMHGTVSVVRRNARGGLVLTLANGHVWQQSGSERLFADEGDPVIIRRGSFSAFYLSMGTNARRYRFSRLE